MAYEWSELSDRIDALKPMAGIVLPDKPAKVGLGFSSNAPGVGLVARAMKEEIHEGGDAERNRWEEFSRVAGALIQGVRNGGVPSIDTARDMTLGWMHAKMKPAWPEQRFHSEFDALLAKDIRDKGAMPQQAVLAPLPAVAEVPSAMRFNHLTLDGLKSAMGQHWAAGEVPKRRWIVPGLVMAGKPHLFVAEGGAGKTTMMLDLAVKIAGGASGAWLGREINPVEMGCVVIITGEDDADELKAKMRALFSPAQLAAAGANLIILPLVNIGGTFPMVQTRRRKIGFDIVEEHGASEQWETLLAALHALSLERRIAAVFVDTLNATLHGEENSATVIQEYMRQVNRVCGELAAALLIAHHVRKRGRDPIVSKFDMADAVRGSSALLGSVRMAIGIWPCPDWANRLAAMNEPVRTGMIYFAAVIKANNPEAMSETLTLLRTERGNLIDVTGRDQVKEAKSKDRRPELKAWLAAAVARAVEEGHPFQLTSTSKGLYARRQHLPPILRVLSKHGLPTMAQEMIDAGQLVMAKIDGANGKSFDWLDVPGGYADRQAIPSTRTALIVTDGGWSPDWTSYRFDEQMIKVVPKHSQE